MPSNFFLIWTLRKTGWKESSKKGSTMNIVVHDKDKFSHNLTIIPLKTLNYWSPTHRNYEVTNHTDSLT